jgi:SAM-dependent methyltransferase
VIGRIQRRLRSRFHETRAELFVRLLRPRRGSSVLDLGGGDGSLAARMAGRVPLEITVADLSADNRARVLALGFRHVLLEEGPLPFDDGAFDIVLSNSVIEHVTLPKARCSVAARVDESEWKRAARSSQRRFAAEIRRVGRGYFVQTPHRHFPLDAHVQLPFVQYLSHDDACRLVRWTDRFWIKSCLGIVDWELFTPAELAALFPDGAIHVERLLGLPKSIVAWKRAEH